jgi:serine/threonine-protein kinase
LIFVVEEDRGRPGPIDDVIQLYRRSLDDLAATAIQGTEMGADPFFSPDGEWLAFSGPDGLKKVSLRGGAPIAIPGAGSGGTGTWLNDNHLVYTNRRDLFRLPADGGQAELLLNWAQLQKGEISIDAPNSLPNMPAFLLSLQGLDPARSAIAVWSGGALNRIASGGLMPLYLPTGHMLYQRRTKPGVNQYDAYVLQFEVSSLKVVGKEVPVLEGIRNGQLAVSATGTLAYNGRGTESVVHHLAWVELGGKAEPIQDKQQGQYYLSPRISPDGARLLYSMSHSNADSRLFVQDMATRASHMVGGIAAWEGVWTPDSRRVVFIQLNPEHTAGNLFWQAADGTGPAERLTKGDRHQQPLFVTPDGSSLVFNEQSLDTGYDLWQLSLQGDHTPRPLLQSKANEHLAAITQDGRYMAYVSDQSGRDEIWVSSFPEVQGAQQVSTEGGTGPLWAPDGKTLYYRDAAATRLFAVPVTWQPSPAFGAPMVTNGWWVNDYPWVRQYDITPDGKRFVMIVGTSTAGNEITVVQNWLEEVKRICPTGK